MSKEGSLLSFEKKRVDAVRRWVGALHRIFTITYLPMKMSNYQWWNVVCFPFSKQEEARAEYKRLKRKMMETKRKKENEGQTRSGIQHFLLC